MNRVFRALACAGVGTTFFASAPAALACSSCGCTLNSDWSSQGYTGGEGIRVDLRYDYINQTELRGGRRALDRGSIDFPADNEIQQLTRSRTYTLGIDYSPAPDWGVTLQVPYLDRYHTTVAEGDTDISSSQTHSIADVRVIGRYLGFSEERDTGLQFGIKLPTGAIHTNFNSGPQESSPLDRGLQPGTGTTDLILGVYHFGQLNDKWNYFAQVQAQQPLGSKEDFKPGLGVSANAGLRYALNDRVAPQIQINVRNERRESGANADIPNSGSTLAYLSPGVTVNITGQLSAYAFLQVPIYQRVNGLQIEPRYTASMGLRYSL